MESRFELEKKYYIRVNPQRDVGKEVILLESYNHNGQTINRGVKGIHKNACLYDGCYCYIDIPVLNMVNVKVPFYDIRLTWTEAIYNLGLTEH